MRKKSKSRSPHPICATLLWTGSLSPKNNDCAPPQKITSSEKPLPAKLKVSIEPTQKEQDAYFEHYLQNDILKEQKSIEARTPKKKPSTQKEEKNLEPAKHFKKTFDRYCCIFLSHNEKVVSFTKATDEKPYIIYKTDKNNVIYILNKKNTREASGMHAFGKLGLVPNYNMFKFRNQIVVKMKDMPLTLFTWLADHKPSVDKVYEKLDVLSSKIELFQKNNLTHRNLSLSNILLDFFDKKKIYFSELNHFLHVTLSKTNEFSLFAKNIYNLQEMDMLNDNYKQIINEYLLKNMNKKNTIQGIQNQKYIIPDKKKDDELIEIVKKNVPKDETFLQEEFLRGMVYFMESSYGKQVFQLLPIPFSKVKTITFLFKRDNMDDKPWLFLVNNLYVLKITKTQKNAVSYEAKYEILMHQKFIEASNELQFQIAPWLYHYNSWSFDKNKYQIIGFSSQKVATVENFLLETNTKNQESYAKFIHSFFVGIKTYLNNACKMGLVHFDAHYGNWGFVEEKKKDGSLRRNYLLFDYDYAATGKFNAQGKFELYDSKICNWNFELNTMAYGIGLLENSIPKENLFIIISNFVEMHQKLFQLKNSKRNQTLYAPPKTKVTLENMLEILASYPTKNDDLIDHRITPNQKRAYVTKNQSEDWHPSFY